MKKNVVTRQRPCLLIEDAGMRCPSPASPSTSVRFRAHVSRSENRFFILSFSVIFIIYLKEKVSRKLRDGLKIIIRIFKYNFFYFFSLGIQFLRPSSGWRPRRPPGSPMPRAGPALGAPRRDTGRAHLRQLKTKK